MAVRHAKAEWKGTLKEGQGTVKVGSGLFEGPYSFPSRFEEGKGTNPEELIGAAHSACYSMALSAGLEKAGHKASRVHTTANVHFSKVGEGFAITKIELECEAEVPNMDEKTFQQEAETAKTNCPISKALSATEITLKARLLQHA